MKDKELLGRVKRKFHHYLSRFSGDFNRPDWKFLVQMCFGFLESGEVKLSKKDRGGDRIELMRRLLRDEIYFVIRQPGRRHLWYGVKRRSLVWVSRKVALSYSFRVKKKHKNRLVERVYCAGER